MGNTSNADPMRQFLEVFTIRLVTNGPKVNFVKLFAEVDVCQFESKLFGDRVTKKVAFNCNLTITIFI